MVQIIKINPTHPDSKIIHQARNLILKGKLVVFPTDTVYGLATDPFNRHAVITLLKVKQRTPEKGLPILVASIELARQIVEFTPLATTLATHFWPGALTLVLVLKKSMANEVTGNRRTLGIRIPNHQVARQLAEAPIVGTSANISGEKDTITAEDAIKQLGDSIDLVLDGGPTTEGLPSTIIDLCGPTPHVIREGAIKLSLLDPFLR